MKKVLGAVVLILALSSCTGQEEASLQKEVDSLRLEVSKSKRMTAILLEIGGMIDSVDVLRGEATHGTTFDKHRRLLEINDYVALMQSRGDEIEKELENSRTASVYTWIIENLKEDLFRKGLDFRTLSDQAASVKSSNDTLQMIVRSQAAEIHEGVADLAAIEQELSRLSKEVSEFSEKGQGL